MEPLTELLSVLLDAFVEKTGFDAGQIKRWLADTKRRRLGYAAAMFTLSLLILLVYACSQRPDV